MFVDAFLVTMGVLAAIFVFVFVAAFLTELFNR